MREERIVYSLPFKCPIPWPVRPSYAIAPPTTTDLEQAYSNALYHQPDAHNLALDSFARLLLQLLPSQPRDSLNSLLRSLVLPIHDFDLKYRSTVPEALAPPPALGHEGATDADTLPVVPGLESGGGALSEHEKAALLGAHARWLAVLLEKRDADERAKAKEPAAGDASSAQGQEDATMVHGATEGGPMEFDKPASWTVDDESLTDWIAELELMETRLQCLLLLALVALPPPSVLPRKPKKKHDPERYAATLDPELLLDFLTDRLQIWRVEKAVKTMVANVVSVSDPQLSQPSADGGANASGDAVAGKVLEKDEVHDWWDDIVEPLFSPRVPTAVLLLHREKLFPPTALPKLFSPSLAPAPLARDRTLLSLDKSARRKNTDNDKTVSESPTMKRLLGLGGNHDHHQASMIGGDLSFIPLEEGDVFKVPAPPKKRGTTAVASDADPAPSSTAAPATISAAPIPEASSSDQPPTKARRKQERPRPLPRGDSRIVASSKGLFNRREVSLPRRPGVPAPRAAKKSFGGAELVDTSRAHSQPPGEAGAAGGGGRKRKALSPRKLKTSESLSHFAGASTSSLTLVPDTPLKVASLPRSFSRTQSLPSFAALGAAFRPGSTSDPFVLHGAVGPPRGGMVAGCGPGRGGSVFPPAPILPGEKEGAEEMEWEREVWRDRGEEGMGTPVAQRTGLHYLNTAMFNPLSLLPTSVTSTATAYGEAALDRGLLPDPLVRQAIRILCSQRLAEIASASLSEAAEAKWAFVEDLKRQPLAIETETANEQHYEVATEFIQSCLGPNMKYSCALYPTGKETLEQAEVLMLESYCVKAKLLDGMSVLDLGCGWGSLTLFLAKRYPNSRITSLSNSTTQKLHIDSQAALRGLMNVEVFTGDVKEFDFAGSRTFDRVLSIEMFEHMKNYDFLLRKISSWLKPNAEAVGGEALLFVHIFCHATTPYHFEENDGWMSRNFFSGGTMPSFDLFAYFQSSLTLEHSWWLNGNHYAKTCEDWLLLQDASKGRWIGSGKEGELVALKNKGSMTEEQKKEEGRKSFYRFRIFFMACAEFFALKGGEAWGVGHYLFRQRD